MTDYKNFPHQYRLISSDITEHCNQRCLFCFNDFYTHPQKFVNMSEEVFLKLTHAMEFVPDGGFFLSCIYEPLIHPKFAEFLSLIPQERKQKVFFTTNLSAPINDMTWQVLAQANISHFNISVETFNQALYQKICGTKNFEQFHNNLIRLNETFASFSNPPQIRYITMALQDNYDELMEIVTNCARNFRASHHELRVPYYGTQKDDGFSIPSEISANMRYTEQQLLPPGKLTELQLQLDSLPYSISTDFSVNNETFKEKNYLLALQKERQSKKFFDVRSFADGRLYFFGLKEYFNLNEISDISIFFTEKLYQLNEAFEKKQP